MGDEIDKNGAQRSTRRAASVRGLAGVVAMLALLGSVGGLLGRWHWMLDLFNHFRFQYAVVLLVAGVGLLLLRSWRMGAVASLGLVLNLAFVLPLYRGGPLPMEATALRLGFSVMHFNVNTANRDHAGVIAEIGLHGPDLLFVQEVDRVWLDALVAGLVSEYALVVAEARSDNFGMACFARREMAEDISGGRAFDLTDGAVGVPVIEVGVEREGRACKVLAIHPLPPVSGEYAQARDTVLAAAGQWAAQQDGACVVVGDFNATPWSTAFRDLQSAGGLVNSQAGFGQAPTWPAGVGMLAMIPIDHLLHSEELVTVDRVLGAARGSDHRPLVVELGWRE